MPARPRRVIRHSVLADFFAGSDRALDFFASLQSVDVFRPFPVGEAGVSLIGPI
jgi:hypothetical protein